MEQFFLTYKYTKLIDLPGITIRLLEGPDHDLEEMPFLNKLYISSRARAFLENFQPSRSRSGTPKCLSKKQLEERLDQMIRVYGINRV
jgi:hypothetical protein